MQVSVTFSLKVIPKDKPWADHHSRPQAILDTCTEHHLPQHRRMHLLARPALNLRPGHGMDTSRHVTSHLNQYLVCWPCRSILDQDVGWLDVKVNQLSTVQRPEPKQHMAHKYEQFLFAEIFSLGQQITDRAITQFCLNVQMAIFNP